VAEDPHVLRDAAEALDLPYARGEGALRELRDAVLHHPLVFARLEVDHGRPSGITPKSLENS
jgi:hypothetical protein